MLKSFLVVGSAGVSLLLLVVSLNVAAPKEAPAFQLPPAPLGYVCLKTPKPPKIDGKLDDVAWQAAEWTSDFVDIEGDKKPKPKYRTRVKMLWDEQGIYFGVDIEDPHIWATAKEHDAYIFHTDNDFEVFIDPDGDTNHYAEMEMNALNTTWDLLLTKPYRNRGMAIDNWEIKGFQSAVHIDGTLNDPKNVDQRWTIEIFWPWKSLNEISTQRFPPKDGEHTRINFSRVNWDVNIVKGEYVRVPKKPEYNWVWSPTGQINMHMPERWGYVQFSTQTTGPVVYRPNPQQRSIDILNELQIRQLEYRVKHKRFASKLDDLNWPSSLETPAMTSTLFGFEASLLQDKTTMAINQDGLLLKR